MDQVGHPLDWWATDGYDEVVRQTGWDRGKARREVRKSIRAHGWHPFGHAGYETLRKKILSDQLTNHDLT